MTTPGTTGTPQPSTTSRLPDWRHPLLVVAHPDDESFGLGALVDTWVMAGAEPAVLCFTHGEASTLHGTPGDLRVVRAAELAAAAEILGVRFVELLDEPDGHLADTGPDQLSTMVERSAKAHAADGLLVFDLGGVTGHPDHDTATRAAVAAATALGLDVLGWTLPDEVAGLLAAETGAPFVGRSPEEIDLVVEVRRERQLEAVGAHPSQAVPGSVLWRRLELLGDHEHLRWLRREVSPS